MRRRSGFGILIVIIGCILGFLAGTLVVRWLPEAFLPYKQIIFFGIVIVIGGTCAYISGKCSGRRR